MQCKALRPYIPKFTKKIIKPIGSTLAPLRACIPTLLKKPWEPRSHHSPLAVLSSYEQVFSGK